MELATVYKQQLHKLLPVGQAWQWHDNSAGDRLLGLFATGMAKIDTHASLIQQSIAAHRQDQSELTLAGIQRRLDEVLPGARVFDNQYPTLRAGFTAGDRCFDQQWQATLTIRYTANDEYPTLRAGFSAGAYCYDDSWQWHTARQRTKDALGNYLSHVAIVYEGNDDRY